LNQSTPLENKKMPMKKLDSFDLLKKFVSVNSSTDSSNEEFVFLLENILEKICQQVEIFGFKKDSINLFNLVAKIEGKSNNYPTIFIGHTDTVQAGNNWRTDPLKLKDDGKNFIGLGASDMKGSLAGLISALSRLDKKKKPENDIYLLLDADEEGSGLGAKKLLEKLNFKNAQIIIMEPTENNLQIFQKACLGMNIVIKGEARHSSLTSYKNNIKNNAIYKANKIISELVGYEKEILDKKKDRIFGESSQNIGFIKGGLHGNSVADDCIFKIDRRLLPYENLDEEIKRIKNLVFSANSDSSIEISFRGESFRTAKQSDSVKELKKTLQKLNLKKKFVLNPFWTEAGFFKKWGDCVIIGPGTPDSIHKPDEFIKKSSLEDFENICYSLISS